MNVWIGTLHVTPQRGNDLLEGALGAIVPILALVESEEEFATQAEALMNSYGFDVPDIYDVELFEKRLIHSEVSEEIRAIADRLCEGEQIIPGNFEAYESLD